MKQKIEGGKKKLDKNMLGDTKADIAIVNILNEIDNRRLTRRVCGFLCSSVDFVIHTIKIVPSKNNTAHVPTPTILYQLLKKHFAKEIDGMLLYGHEELRIPLQCSTASRLKRYFNREKGYNL